MKHKKLWNIALVCAVLLCCAAVCGIGAAAADYGSIDAVKLPATKVFYQTVYDDTVFQNAASVKIAEEDLQNIKAVVKDAQNAPNVYTVTALNIGEYTLALEDTQGAEHTVYLKIDRVHISAVRFSGFKNEIPFTGKEQPFALKGEYNGYPATFEVQYSDFIGPANPANLTITGTGNFFGQFGRLYRITLPQAKIAKFTHYKNAIKVELKNYGSPYKYQLQVRKVGGAWQNYDLNSATVKTFTGLKYGDKYQFRVRTYVTVNGKNKFYEKSLSTPVTQVIGLSLADCKVTGVTNKVYNGKAQTQKVKVTYNGKPINVKIVYGDNKTPGLHYITLVGSAPFADSRKVYYHILPTAPKIIGLLEYYSKQTDSFSQCAVVCQAPASGAVEGYQFAVKMKGSDKWQYFDNYSSAATLHLIQGLSEGKIYYVMARAYVRAKNAGAYSGAKTYGKWSAQERVYLCNKEMENDFFYCTEDTIKGYVTGALAGEKAQITVEGKTYTVKFTKDAKKYNFKCKIGKHKAGTTIRLRYLNKFGQIKIQCFTISYLSEDVKKGYTGAQVKLVPGFDKPDRVSKSGKSTIWEYVWQTGENRGIYGVLTFTNGKLVKWEYYDVEL